MAQTAGLQADGQARVAAVRMQSKNRRKTPFFGYAQPNAYHRKNTEK